MVLDPHDQNPVRTQDDGQDQSERGDSNQHDQPPQATAWMCSNMSVGRGSPSDMRRSAHFGRMPVARKNPQTFPFLSSLLRSKRKMSCIVMTACSMPVISVMAVTLRLPPDR